MFTGPATVLLISCVVFVVTFWITFAMIKIRISDKKNEIRNVVGLCIALPIMMLAIYDVNRTSLGGYIIWAWCKSLVFTAFIVYAIYSIIELTRMTLTRYHTLTDTKE